MPVKSYQDDKLLRLRDSDYASKYLKVAFDETLKDGDTSAFLLALKNVVDAKLSVSELASKAQISRQHLHLLFSGKGNPTIETLASILRVLDLSIDFKPLSSDD